MACSHLPTTSGTTNFVFDSKTFTLTEHQKSIPGRYLLSGFIPTASVDKTQRMSLFTLATDGEAKIVRSVQSRYRELAITEFRPVEQGLYAYVSCASSKIRCAPATIQFIDFDGQDIFPRPVPAEHDDINFHDFARGKNGNYFFLFANFNFQNATLDNTIQEWDAQGRKVFNWRMDEHAKELTKWDSRAIAHINALDIDRDGNLFISLWHFNTIFKIAYPSGKIVATITSPDWKFENDPYNGFKAQHGIRSLPNGNIMLLDNGDGLNGRLTRAVEYSLDFATKTAKLVWEYRMPKDEPTSFRQIGGSVQRLSNGNTVIGWGVPASMTESPNMRIASEVDSTGQLVRELKGQHLSFRIWFEETRL